MLVRTVVMALALLLVLPGAAAAQQPPQEIEFVARDEAAKIDRYRITILPGGSLFAVAVERFPLISLEEGYRAAIAPIEESFRRAFPEREISQVYPGESFVVDIPMGTFVTEHVERTPDEVRYTSFGGDRLTHYPRNPYVVYRLVRHETPNQAEVRLTGPQERFLIPDPDPVEIAKQVYQVDPPDFIQVRYMRGLISDSEPRPRVTVDLDHRYLDTFRNYRDRALQVEKSEDGLNVYVFSQAQAGVPFLRVEDAVGDETSAANFPRLFRVEYYEDGTVKRYLLTQPGDLLAVLRKPDEARWAKLYNERWVSWQDGEVSALEPFSPAVTEIGSVIPGRILVLTHQPEQVKPASSIECFGIPLVLLTFGLVLQRIPRRASRVSR